MKRKKNLVQSKFHLFLKIKQLMFIILSKKIKKVRLINIKNKYKYIYIVSNIVTKYAFPTQDEISISFDQW